MKRSASSSATATSAATPFAPGKIASAALFLLSDEASFVNGAPLREVDADENLRVLLEPTGFETG